MGIKAVINRQAGTLRSMEPNVFSEHLIQVFQATGNQVQSVIVPAEKLDDALTDAAEDSQISTLLAVGGDGTVSRAAQLCHQHDKVLGILPGGTMNLMARSLKIPLGLEAAATALAQGTETRIDVATANGRLFLHQYSVGMQPHLVKTRSKLGYTSRIGKIISGLRATLKLLRQPPSFRVELKSDTAAFNGKQSMIAISNNLHGEGHLPYPDNLHQNVLGIYRADVISAAAWAKLAADLMTGSWSANPDLVITRSGKVEIRFPDYRTQIGALIDGEMIPVEEHVILESHARALRVIIPATSGEPPANQTCRSYREKEIRE